MPSVSPLVQWGIDLVDYTHRKRSCSLEGSCRDIAPPEVTSSLGDTSQFSWSPHRRYLCHVLGISRDWRRAVSPCAGGSGDRPPASADRPPASAARVRPLACAPYPQPPARRPAPPRPGPCRRPATKLPGPCSPEPPGPRARPRGGGPEKRTEIPGMSECRVIGGRASTRGPALCSAPRALPRARG